MNLSRYARLFFIPDEGGELAAQDPLASVVETAAQMPSGDYGAAMVKMVLAFIATIALLFATLWFLRRLIQNRLQKGSADSAIVIVEKRMLSPKTTLYLVEIDQKKVLIAESQLEVRKIETIQIG